MRMGNYKCDTHKANQIVSEQPCNTLSLPGCRALGERCAANGWEGTSQERSRPDGQPAPIPVLRPF